MNLKAGDIIGFSGEGFVADFINAVTFGVPRWHLNHVAIIAPYNGDLMLFESTMLNSKHEKCAITGKRASGVQAHHLSDIKMRPGRIWHYPLSRELYRSEARRLTFMLVDMLGRQYDLRGAVRSGGLLIRGMSHVLKPEDLGQMFCSELCAAAYGRLGLLPTGNASSYNPNSFVRRARRAGVLKPRLRIV